MLRTTVRFAVICLSALLIWALHLRGLAAASETADPAIPTNTLMTISSINGVANTGAPDQATISAGDCLSLKLLVKFRTGDFIDVTNDPNTEFVTDPPHGHFTSQNGWCASEADADLAFPIYGRYHSPSANVTVTDTVHVHVLPLAPRSPAASLSLANPEFGSLLVGSPGSTRVATLTNTGNAPLTISSVTLGGANPASFAITAGGGSGSLDPSASRAISVAFNPTGAGAQSATLIVTDDAPGSPHTAPLHGMGIAPVPAVQLDPTHLTFESQVVGTTSPSQSVTLTNTGTGPLTISGVAITGGNADSFGITAGGGGGTLAPGAHRTIAVSFAPTAAGSLSASLQVTSDAPGSPHSASVAGTATAAPKNEGVPRLAAVGEEVVAGGRVALFGADPPDPDSQVTAVRGITDDGSLIMLDYAGTALLRLPPLAGSPAEILLDTTRQDLPDGVGLARLLRVEVSRSGVIAVLALRADNTRGIYRLENRRLTLLAILPTARGPAEMTVDGAGRVAYVVPDFNGTLILSLSAGGPRTDLLRQGQTVANGVPIAGFSDLTSNDAGDLAVLVTRSDGSPLAVLRKRGGAFEVVAATGQVVEPSRGAGVTGALTDLRRPRIGPDGSVVFLGAGNSFVNFFLARPNAQGAPRLEPLLAGTGWNPDPAAFDIDFAAEGAIALRAGPSSAVDSALYVVTPGTGPVADGDVSLIVAGRRDIQPIGRPAFGPGGRLYFLAQNVDLPTGRGGQARVGLYRAHFVGGRWVLDGVAVPGQPVPLPNGNPAGGIVQLFSVTQRPVVSPTVLVFGILYGPPDRLSVPAAGLFQVPLDGTLADGQLVAAEGHAETAAGRLALVNAISYRSDGTLVAGGLLPGAGPLVVTPSAPAGIASAFRIQAALPPSIVPLLATNDLVGGGHLESVLPPFVALGSNRELFIGRISPASSAPGGANEEGLIAVGLSKQSALAVALTPRPAAAEVIFSGFADTRLLSLGPPSVSADANAVNVVFKALLARGGANLTGIFQWTGTGDPTPVALSDRPLVPGDAMPYDLDRWVAAKGGMTYVLARPKGGPARLFAGSGGSLKPLVDTRVTAIAGGGRLADLSDFVLDGKGNLFVTGTTAGGAGLFQVVQGQLTPVAVQGGTMPPMVDGRGKGLVFGSSFQLAPDSARGELIFLATAQKPGAAQSVRGEFHYLQGRLETRVLESVGVAGSRDVAVQTIGDAFPSQSANGVAVSVSFTQKDGWIIVRTQVSPNGKSITSTVIAQEKRGSLADVPRFASLDAGPLLEQEGLTPRAGPVFTISDTGDIAFLASDGTGWGVYQVRIQ